uniref:Uncharacterized protein n=1 Tax=Arundo donax TaxID=35708 RepID=A0A0A9G155_ARUDO
MILFTEVGFVRSQ